MENICYVIWKFKSPDNFVNMGGAENQLLKIIKQFRHSDKNITIIARKTDGDKEIEIFSDNIKIQRINTTNIRYISMILFMIGLFFLIYKINRKKRIDIIHLPLPDIYIAIIYLLRMMLKIPVLTMVAGDELYPQRKKGLWYVDRLVVRYFMLKLDGIQTLNATAYKIGKKLRYNEEKLFLVPMGVVIPSAMRNYKKLTKNIVYIGAMRFHPDKHKRGIKNLDFLIESFEELRKIKSELKLILVGDGNYRIKLEEKTKKLDLQDIVVFVGYQTDIVKYHLIADIFVNPSLREGMPNAVIEAMGSGVFVLCSDIHAHRFLIEDYITGVLFNNTSKSDFINKIIDFYNNPEKSIQIAKNGRKKIEKNFSIDVIVNQLIWMYKKVKYHYIKNNY